MLTDITLGQYFPGDSLLHRMDARVKIILLFFYIMGIFLFDNNMCYGLNTALAILLVFPCYSILYFDGFSLLIDISVFCFKF